MQRYEYGKALITCSKENIASAKAIIYNGGVLENVARISLIDFNTSSEPIII
ncbi:hypothetical protein [Clostridium botulinum]|uniref:hypothetical protein n=1 Tax=Clostridium botulinum TaxID=1491 RepID=UPI0031194E2B